MFTAEQGKLLNQECSMAFNSAWEKVRRSNPDAHARFVMSNCRIALRYLQYIYQIAIEGFPPIAVSLFRTYYEIVCSTMYLAEHRDELADFLNFGRRMYYEIGECQKLQGSLLNHLVPDHRQLRVHFMEKKKRRGGKLLSWHGMTIDDLAKSVGMEKYADQQTVKSLYSKASKILHGDSLLTVLAYGLDEGGMNPMPFAEPTAAFRVDAVALTCGLFIALLASVDVGLLIGFKDELDRLNAVWRGLWKDTTGIDIQDAIDKVKSQLANRFPEEGSARE